MNTQTAGKILQRYGKQDNFYMILTFNEMGAQLSVENSYEGVNSYLEENVYYEIDSNDDIWDTIYYHDIFEKDKDDGIIVQLRIKWDWKPIGKIYGLSEEEYEELLSKGRLSEKK